MKFLIFFLLFFFVKLNILIPNQCKGKGKSNCNGICYDTKKNESCCSNKKGSVICGNLKTCMNSLEEVKPYCIESAIATS